MTRPSRYAHILEIQGFATRWVWMSALPLSLMRPLSPKSKSQRGETPIEGGYPMRSSTHLMSPRAPTFGPGSFPRSTLLSLLSAILPLSASAHLPPRATTMRFLAPWRKLLRYMFNHDAGVAVLDAHLALTPSRRPQRQAIPALSSGLSFPTSPPLVFIPQSALSKTAQPGPSGFRAMTVSRSFVCDAPSNFQMTATPNTYE